MITLLYDFSNQCSRMKVTPSEKHIDAFLMKVDAMQYRNHFIQFCFYHWENKFFVLERMLENDLTN